MSKKGRGESLGIVFTLFFLIQFVQMTGNHWHVIDNI